MANNQKSVKKRFIMHSLLLVSFVLVLLVLNGKTSIADECGNVICETGEDMSCPEDCPRPEEPQPEPPEVPPEGEEPQPEPPEVPPEEPPPPPEEKLDCHQKGERLGKYLWCSNTEDCSPLGGGYCNPNQINRTHNDITNELCGVCVNEQTDKLSCSEKKSNLCVYKEECYPYFKDIKISLFNHIECSSGTTIRQNDDYGNECGVCTIEQGYTFPDLLKYGIGYEGQRCLDNGRAYRYYLVDESSGTIRTKLVWCQKDEVCVQTYDGGLSSSSEAGCQHSPEEEKPELNAPQRPPFPPR